MAGPAPTTRDWRALENAHKPKGKHVLVFGHVQVGATNMEPRLTETPERNPKNLGLNLTIETSGEGADVMVWKGAHFHKEVAANQYDHVIVRWDVGQIANFPIFDDRECANKAAADMKALNAQHPVKGKAAKPAGKKPASKKAAAKKGPATKSAAKKSAAKEKPRSVGGWAKGKKAKKMPTKAAKKKVAKKKTAKRKTAPAKR